MAGSFTPTDFELTPGQVYWTPNGSTAESYLGATLKNIKVTFKYSKAELKADQTGDTALDRRISGGMVSVETEIPQTKDFQLFSYLFPNAELDGTTGFSGNAPSAAIQWNTAVGNSDLAVAGNLRIHPQSFPATNAAYDWNFPLACPAEDSGVVFGPAEQMAFKVVWNVYPDTSVSAAPYEFFTYGDPANIT